VLGTEEDNCLETTGRVINCCSPWQTMLLDQRMSTTFAAPVCATQYSICTDFLLLKHHQNCHADGWLTPSIWHQQIMGAHQAVCNAVLAHSPITLPSWHPHSDRHDRRLRKGPTTGTSKPSWGKSWSVRPTLTTCESSSDTAAGSVSGACNTGSKYLLPISLALMSVSTVLYLALPLHPMFWEKPWRVF